MKNSSAPKDLAFTPNKSRFSAIALAAVLGLGLATGSAFGQDPQAPAPDQQPPSGQQTQSGQEMGGHMHGGRQMPTADEQLKHLSKRLKLSDDQQAKLKPIIEDQHKQMEQLRSDNSLSREDRFSKMQEIRQNSDSQIKSVLNEDQQKNFDKMRADQQNRMKQWHKGGDNAPPAAAPDTQQ